MYQSGGDGNDSRPAYWISNASNGWMYSAEPLPPNAGPSSSVLDEYPQIASAMRGRRSS